MEYVATITSKRQFTIPSKLFKKARLKINQKVLVRADEGVVKIQPMRKLVEDLAGSVPVAKGYKGLTLKQMVNKARNEYYQSRL